MAANRQALRLLVVPHPEAVLERHHTPAASLLHVGGVDGSQIFTHFPPADKYDSDMSAHDMAYVQSNYKDKDLSDRGILVIRLWRWRRRAHP